MINDDNKTIWCGNIAEQVTEEVLYELFLQAGPLEKVRIPKERDGRPKNFAFVTYCHEVSVPYALSLFRGSALYHRTLLMQSRSRTLLPPPIRCFGPEISVDFQTQNNLNQQFAEMTENIREEDHRVSQPPRHLPDSNDKLVMASLQGNWTHRHHPYRPKDQLPQGRDDYRQRDNRNDHSNRNQHPNNWRDRRRNKKGSHYHR